MQVISKILCCSLWISLGFHVAMPVAIAEEPDTAALDFFEKKIRPVLIKQCYSCHSAEAEKGGKLKGGLSLDTREATHVGGDSGAAVVPGDLEESLLIEAIRYGEGSYKMPPAGKLPDAVIADFEKWVSSGAADPRDGTAPKIATRVINWEEARKFWSFRPPERHTPPAVTDAQWSKTGIDPFLLARAEALGLKMAPRATSRELLRRAFLDLTGLPPTPSESEVFLADQSPDAYPRLVDQLLASPRYGERWGRHWLDVARYAEDNTNMGPFNGPYQQAWRYRDWVVNAFNADMPYDQFLIRQLATDFLPETGPEDHAALGFQGLAPSYHKEVALAKLALENRYADEWEDRVDAIGRGLLGLTLACARCHDHKYDPVTSADYYALAGVFASCRQTTRPVISAEEIAKTQPVRDEAASIEKQVAEWEQKNKMLATEIADLEKKLKEASAKPVDPGTSSPKQTETDSASNDAATEPAKTVEPAQPVFDPEQAKGRIAEAKAEIETAKKSIADAKAKIAELAKTPGFVIPMADALTEEQVRVEEINKERMKIVYYPEKPRDLNIFVRGDAGRLGPIVNRRFLQVLSPEGAEPFTEGSGRLELARAIASRDNPLTARVIVNRVWGHHFGVGIVDSPSNFGETGSRPSHAELLDDLAVRFMEQGWSLKWLHREIMLSAAYQQSAQSVNSAEQQTVDPDNRLLTHFNRRRLNAEAFRDSILAVSGELDPTVGGPSGDADQVDFRRRTIYAMISRHKLSDTLQTFDFPDPAIHCERRAQTTTPLQQMFVMNSPFLQGQAGALAKRAQREGGPDLETRVSYLYRLLFAREPQPEELAVAQEFLGSETPPTTVPASSAPLTETAPPEFKGARISASVKKLGDKYTVELWLKNTRATHVQPVTGYFFSRGLPEPVDDHGDHFGITGTYQNAPGRLLFYSGTPHRQAVVGKAELAIDTWQHVALVRDGEEVSLFLNGGAEPDVKGTAKVGNGPGVEQVFLGGRLDNFANFQGQLQEIAVFDRALPATEIAGHRGVSGLPAKPHDHAAYAKSIIASKPVAYWPLIIDAADSVRATDLSGQENHGRYEDRGAVIATTGVSRWQRYAHALLSSNEFLFID